jgi:hypothetical protein
MARLGSAISGFGRALLIRLPLAYLGSLALLYWLSAPVGAVLLPVMETELAQIVPGCVAASATLRNGQVKLTLEIRDLPPPSPNPARVRTTMQLGHLLVSPVIALTLLLAWPQLHPRARATAAFWLVLFLFIVQVFDQPFVVADAILSKLGQQDGLGRALWRFWTFLLDNGGRQLLGILAFGMALLIVRDRERSPVNKRANRVSTPQRV